MHLCLDASLLSRGVGGQGEKCGTRYDSLDTEIYGAVQMPLLFAPILHLNLIKFN